MHEHPSGVRTLNALRDLSRRPDALGLPLRCNVELSPEARRLLSFLLAWPEREPEPFSRSLVAPLAPTEAALDAWLEELVRHDHLLRLDAERYVVCAPSCPSAVREAPARGH